MELIVIIIVRRVDRQRFTDKRQINCGCGIRCIVLLKGIRCQSRRRKESTVLHNPQDEVKIYPAIQFLIRHKNR